MPHKPSVYAAFALSAFRSEAVPTHSNPREMQNSARFLEVSSACRTANFSKFSPFSTRRSAAALAHLPGCGAFCIFAIKKPRTAARHGVMIRSVFYLKREKPISIAPLSRRDVFFIPIVSVIHKMISATRIAIISVSFFIFTHLREISGYFAFFS